MKMPLFFAISSFGVTFLVYGWLLYKAYYGLEFSQSDMWASIVIPLYVIGWTSNRKKTNSSERGYSACDLFLLAAAICTALEIYFNSHPSPFLLTTTVIGTLILPIQYIFRAAKKQE